MGIGLRSSRNVGVYFQGMVLANEMVEIVVTILNFDAEPRHRKNTNYGVKPAVVSKPISSFNGGP